VSQSEGAPTVQEDDEHRSRALKSAVASDPLVRAALEAFPGATIAAVRERQPAMEPGIDADGISDDEPAADDETGSGEDSG
jgi:DNA polymerase III subunit gamma/tau